MDTLEVINLTLPVLAKELAVPFSALSEKVLKPRNEEEEKQIREAMSQLAKEGLVKTTESGGGDVIYSLTAKGFMEWEHRTKRGLAKLF